MCVWVCVRVYCVGASACVYREEEKIVAGRAGKLVSHLQYKTNIKREEGGLQIRRPPPPIDAHD